MCTEAPCSHVTSGRDSSLGYGYSLRDVHWLVPGSPVHFYLVYRTRTSKPAFQPVGAFLEHFGETLQRRRKVGVFGRGREDLGRSVGLIGDLLIQLLHFRGQPGAFLGLCLRVVSQFADFTAEGVLLSLRIVPVSGEAVPFFLDAG